MVPAIKTPGSRLRLLWDLPVRPERDFVLYWMTASRRAGWNFALDRAVELATELGKPLVVLEGLRAGYRWANDRFHRFVLDGMAVNQRAFEGTAANYYAYVEPKPGEGSGLLRELAASACAVVTDDSPMFFLPRMLASARLEVEVRFEAVDTNGLFPVRATERSFTRAFDFRRLLQRELGPHLSELPSPNPLAGVRLPALGDALGEVERRWPRASDELLRGEPSALAELPIDHSVGPTELTGGATAGAELLTEFVETKLAGYDESRNRPEASGTSSLSGYLHFGHVSPHQVFSALTEREGWTPDNIGECHKGKREGWWGLEPSTEAFMDQLVTWRELGLNAAVHQPDYDSFDSIPDWAKKTLEDHADDEREHVYGLAEFEEAATHDELWNAAQNQLRGEGVIHGYLRMLWGKKILHWSPSPRAAHEVMVELNNKYALDGRDPNSHSGILWTLGKFDRAWGPERPIFGKVRYMTSANTRRKLRVDDYIARWSGKSLF